MHENGVDTGVLMKRGGTGGKWGNVREGGVDEAWLIEGDGTGRGS